MCNNILQFVIWINEILIRDPFNFYILQESGFNIY